MFLQHLLLAALLSSSVHAQCQNYGSVNDSSCACPPGFGGDNCSQPACGGDIFQGSKRQTASSLNLTSSDCSCESGWTGTGCNVCQTANACQNAFSHSSYASSSSSGLGTDGQNDTLVCNTGAQVYASSQMSCQVINPTLQAIYPLSSNLNILRTLQPNLTPVPNITGFGSPGSVFAQLFYDGVEQFYCHADSCSQDMHDNSSDWSCQNLQCTCITNTTFCGAVVATNLTATIDGLSGTLGVNCGAVDSSTGTASCNFTQSVLNSLFGSSGLTLSGCTFGECLHQSVIDSTGNSTSSTSSSSTGTSLSPGVIAGLAVVGGLIGLGLLLLLWGFFNQRRARKANTAALTGHRGGVGVEWTDISYTIPTSSPLASRASHKANAKLVLDNVSGRVAPGQMMAILGPSGAGKTSLVEIIAGKSKSGSVTGTTTTFLGGGSDHRPAPRVGFVPQQDVLPPTLTVREALLFAARLRLPESVPGSAKLALVEDVMEQLGLASLADTRIGGAAHRGLSGGEMRRVSIGLELVARPDVLILDEPTSGLDSVSAANVANVLRALAHDPENPRVVIASIHQPSSHLYQSFDEILLLAGGRALYSGPGGFAPTRHFAGTGAVEYKEGWNIAEWLLEIASAPPEGLTLSGGSSGELRPKEDVDVERDTAAQRVVSSPRAQGSSYSTTFLTQLEVLAGREWKILRRDKLLFLTHVAVASVLGVFCGGLYYQTNDTIAGFQSRVGCLFFLGALIAFSTLSALYNVVEVRPLFLRERASGYYSPTAWLLSRVLFDMLPLRIIPTIIVSTITYWMAGLSHDAARFFKFLFILVLYTIAMTLFNFLLATVTRNGGVAILVSALFALYQMTYAGFFVHLNSIPPVLRWLQWLCPLKYTLEALSVNEVGSGLMIRDTLQGVPVDVSATLIMNLLFGFGDNNYYGDVLVLFAFIAGFGVGVIAVVWWKVRERR